MFVSKETAVSEGSGQDREQQQVSSGLRAKTKSSVTVSKSISRAHDKQEDHTPESSREEEEKQFSRETIMKVEDSEKDSVEDQRPHEEGDFGQEPGAELSQDERPVAEAERMVQGDLEQRPEISASRDARGSPQAETMLQPSVSQERQASQEPAGAMQEEVAPLEKESDLSRSYSENAAREAGLAVQAEEESPRRPTSVEMSPKEGEPSRLPTPLQELPLDDGELSVVSSAHPGMMFEEKAKEVSTHPLVSIA